MPWNRYREKREKGLKAIVSNTEISIAMTTYNGAAYLREQLESFSSQTRPPDELIVCDDGSNDETCHILHTFQKEANFIVKIFENPKNLGVNKNFEKALSLCSGNVIFMSDQDDVWFTEKIETVQRLFDQDAKVQVIVNDQINARRDLSHEGVSRLARRRVQGYKDETFATGCCTSLRREWLTYALPLGVPGFDIWINRLASLAGARRLLDEPLQLYRRHGENVSPGIGAEAERPEIVRPLKRQHRTRQEWIDLWEREIQYNEIYASRLDFIAREIPDQGPLAQASACDLRHKADDLKERLAMIRRPRWQRPIPIFKMLARGSYDSFNGARSAFSDIIR